MLRSLRDMSRNCKVALTSCNNVLAIAPDACDETDSVIRALRRLNIDAKVVTWDEATINWSNYAGVVISQTWDYSQKFESFMQWLNNTSIQTKVFNSPRIVRWNADKIYLKELEAHGVRIVPTLWVNSTSPADQAVLATKIAEKQWSSLISKASVGCDADSVKKFDAYNDEAHAYTLNLFSMGHHTVLLQPYLEGIRSFGEVSMIYIDSSFSHAVLKTPAADENEFRVQEKFGGAYVPMDATNDMLQLGSSVVHALKTLFPDAEDAPLYCRIDIIPLNNEKDIEKCDFAVSEVELIEPHLYLSNTTTHLSAAGKQLGEDRLAQAIRQRLNVQVELFAVLRVDTHGNRDIVQEKLTLEEAKVLETKYDSLPHHQGYYVVRQDDVASELNRTK